MFARNLANRLWKQMFGLPLADPVDGLDPARLDPAQPPPEPWAFQASHPPTAGEPRGRAWRNRISTCGPSCAPWRSPRPTGSVSRVTGDWTEGTVPLFGRHYARRMEGEEVHDAIARATGVSGSYAIAGWSDRVSWAMQLPEPVEPAGDAAVNNFMNTFLRGNRDTLDRSQAGSIQQELALMNDNFVISRVKTGKVAQAGRHCADRERGRCRRRAVSHVPFTAAIRRGEVGRGGGAGQGRAGERAQTRRSKT